MTTLNRSLPFTTTEGADVPWMYEQSGVKFDGAGNQVADAVIDNYNSLLAANAAKMTEYTTLTQAQYDALTEPVPNMLYLIVG